ncbi:LacI family DNA-binding transcriptional regulator [Kitasatospora sp. DSM 101779]|uniref:LacI family DNA-binding transcriptional regulator n=1 Tax=Kitasatospora sp. DSM 101779 TaxID=2853165 RepID=UPI0021DAB3C8|nr:LacI family DNA-binding transcriptional regulator [Kitasatospora sp. DSM 101779]
MRDVADRAGVSTAAVSLALNDRPGVSAATRERILTPARDLGWTPNTAARSLSGRQTDTIGLVLARPAPMLGWEPFFMDFIAGVESVLVEHRCSLLLRLVGSVEEEAEVQRAWWQGRRVGGSLLVDLRGDDPRIAALAGSGLPAVAVGHPSLAGPFPAVWTDDAAAVHEAVRYLAALGHRRIARVGGPAGLGHSAVRARAFEEIAAEPAREEAVQVTADYSGGGGSRATRSLLASARRPTAIVYDNDVMAVAGLSVAAEMGLRVPQDLSLVAWDDSQLCQLVRPQLSAVSRDVFAYGAQAVRSLFDLLANGEAPSRPAPDPVLVPRASTAPPRGGR